MELRFTPIADSALLVTFGEVANEETFRSIIAFDKALERSPPVGLIEVVPALVNVLVSFNPLLTDHDHLEAALRSLQYETFGTDGSATQRIVQVCYDEPFCHDLQAVADACGLQRESVIKAHLDGDYKVLMYGFAPGYAYMGGVPEEIQVPRKPAPVRDIAAGSVMIAGTQCLVTTIKMPTGWSIIGRSPTPILMDDPTQPFLFDVGDTVTFERIDYDTYMTLAGRHGDE